MPRSGRLGLISSPTMAVSRLTHGTRLLLIVQDAMRRQEQVVQRAARSVLCRRLAQNLCGGPVAQQ